MADLLARKRSKAERWSGKSKQQAMQIFDLLARFMKEERGIEIAGHAGTSVKAAAAGRVVYAGNGIKTYGLMVIIKHEDGFVTAYGNNRRLLVHEGDAVQRGAAIAEMGTQSDGEARLQFEMREGSHAVDPLAHLPADCYVAELRD